MLIDITKDDINLSIVDRSICPLERSLTRALDNRVNAGYATFGINGVPKRYMLPQKARLFAIKFDCDILCSTQPTSIEFEDITINDQKEILLQGIPLRGMV